MDMGYFRSLLPEIRDRGWDMRIHYEVKSNLKRDQIELLRDSGVRHIQPGIESLSSSVLKLMEKGVTGARNVQILRDCEEANLTVSWNYLVGFPGEEEELYEAVLRQLPALAHLQPPSLAARIVLERFSPYFNKPWLGFEDRTPGAVYPVIYALDSEQLSNMVYLFEAPERGISEQTRGRLAEAIDTWRAAYNAGSQLVHRDRERSIEIEDRREGWAQRGVELCSPLSVAVHRALRRPLRLPALVREVEQQGAGTANEVKVCLESFMDSGFVFDDEGTYIGLSTNPIPFRTRFEYA